MVLNVEHTARYEMMTLNVGGTIFNLRRTTLSCAKCPILQEIFGGRWDARLPRDSENSIFLDISPSAFKDVILLVGRDVSSYPNTEDRPKHWDGVFGHLAHSLELEKVLLDGTVDVINGSTVLSRQKEYNRMMLSWLRENLPSATTGRLKLLYRGSLHGFNTSAFHERCDDAHGTVVLVRCGNVVVGGYTDQSWSGTGLKESTDTFVFSLLDSRNCFKPGKMMVKEKNGKHYAINCNGDSGPDFCGPLLRIEFEKNRSLVTRNTTDYPYTDDAVAKTILDEVHGQVITDVEVFKVESQHTPPKDPPNRCIFSVNFESLLIVPPIKDIVRLEEAALSDANLELLKADEALRFGEESLAIFFGPANTMVTPAKEGVDTDGIVHLNVRGHFMSTRRSTLVQCRHSVLAERFGVKRLSITKEEQAVDENGRHVMDYCPVAFSRVLDVLRIRAVNQWQVSLSNTPKTGMELRHCVYVKEKEKEGVVEVVDSLFPGCPEFILEHILYE
ncbi:unnamed protein product [Choristocarpus tenellus]